MKMKLANGIELDPDGRDARTFDNYARNKGLKNIRVFLATHPDKREFYLIVNGTDPVFESQQYEAVAAYIDMMALAQEFGVA